MKKILAVASAGGHWTQLRAISPAFESFDITYLTTKNNPAVDNLKVDKPVLTVNVADRNSKLLVLFMALRVCFYVLKTRPDIVLSTGAAPGFFAIFFGKLIGAKTIWLDSIANYEKLSMSGQKASRYADLMLTQWPHLEGVDQAKYWGQLL